MKKHILLVFLFITCFNVYSQNYIKSKEYKLPTSTSIASPNITQAAQKITFYDGLGRPIQQKMHQQSTTGKDIIIPMTYDAYGRRGRQYLPYPTSSANLAYDSNALTDVLNYSDYSGQLPYSDTDYEQSPLDRIEKLSSPGNTNDWAMNGNHEVRMNYLISTASDNVKIMTATASWNPTNELYDISLTQNGSSFYNTPILHKKIIKNENWISGSDNTTEEYTNMEGQVILKRSYENSMPHDTYYVYDQFGNLTYVIPPKADSSLTSTVLNDLCYQYKYDNKNRMVEKKLPGKLWEFIVYDKLDRIVMTGPTRPPFSDRTDNGWLINKYDHFNRLVLTGWVSSSSTIDSGIRKARQSDRNNETTNFSESRLATGSTTTSDNIGAIPHSYSKLCIPTSGFHLLSVMYYDDYNYVGAPTVPASVEGDPVFYNNTVKPIGLPTGKWVRAVSTTGSFRNTLSYSFYDYKARAIRSVVRNHENSPGGYTQVDSKLDFEGKASYTVTLHKRINSETGVTVWNYYTYDNQGKILTNVQKVNSSGIPQLIVKNTYDELGKLISKNVGGTDVTTYAGLQKVDYSYNIRGWLTGINDVTNLSVGSDPKDLFAFKLNYNNVENENNYTGTKLYNGNISETYWRTASDDILRKYGYQYDSLDRLKNAIYQKPGATTVVTNSYNESMSYDKNGNMVTLQRNGEIDDEVYTISIDNLTYSYDSNNATNRLMKVTDSTNNPTGFIDDSNGTNDTADDYAYDNYGNMTKDDNKGITNIVYNHLNLPTTITFGTTGSIEYLYDSEGKKIEKTVVQTGTPNTTITTKYLESFQYINNVLQFFPHPEGYVTKTTTKYNYVFNYTDHLGNIRLTYADLDKDGILEAEEEVIECYGGNCLSYFTSCILKENNDYPYGLHHQGYNENSSQAVEYKYRYNKKEFQDELGFNMYDYGARFYDPARAGWSTIDPLAEKMRRWSPYNYCFDNPMRFVDPDGMGPLNWYQNKATGNIQWIDGTGARQGYDNLGSATNVVAGTGQALQLNANGTANDMNSGKFYGANKTIVVNSSTGTTVSTTKSQPNAALEITGTIIDVGGTTGAQFAKYGSATNIASKTLDAGVRGATISNKAVTGLSAIGTVSTAGGVAEGIKAVGLPVQVAVGTVKVVDSYQKEGGFGVNTQLEAGKTAGSIIGGELGAEGGAALGAAIGVWFGGVGAVPGAIIGGIIGGLAGGWAGGKVGEAAVSKTQEHLNRYEGGDGGDGMDDSYD